MTRKHVKLGDTCPKGHPISGDNLGIRRDGHRFCRLCQLASARKARKASLIAQKIKAANVKRSIAMRARTPKQQLPQHSCHTEAYVSGCKGCAAEQAEIDALMALHGGQLPPPETIRTVREPKAVDLEPEAMEPSNP